MFDPVSFYKSLADETRLRCLLLIALEGELCVCELTSALQEIQPKVSRHLALLRKQKLLMDRRQEQWVFYRVNPQLPVWAKDVLELSASNNSGFLKASLVRLRKMGERPDRQTVCC